MNQQWSRWDFPTSYVVGEGLFFLLAGSRSFTCTAHSACLVPPGGWPLADLAAAAREFVYIVCVCVCVCVCVSQW